VLGSVTAGGDDPAMARELTAKRRTENEIEFGRIVAFSDGVFAIAITLLVLNLNIETGLTEGQIDNALWEQREFFLAYAISFAVIGRFWLVHHRFFSEAGIFLLSIPFAYFAPAIAPYLWLVLFVDPSKRLVGRGSGPDDKGDRIAGPRTGD
jgi:hypothetical protein